MVGQQQQQNGQLQQQQSQGVLSEPCVLAQGDSCDTEKQQGDSCCVKDGQNQLAGTCATANNIIVLQQNGQSLSGSYLGCFSSNYTVGIEQQN